MNGTATRAEPPTSAPPRDVVIAFLRALGEYTAPEDRDLVLRIERDVLELIVRYRRRELGVKSE